VVDDFEVPTDHSHAAAGTHFLGEDQVVVIQQVLLRHAPARLPPHHLLLPVSVFQHRLRVPLRRGRVHLGRLRAADGVLLAHGHRRATVLAAHRPGVVPGAAARRADKLPEGASDEDQHLGRGFEAAEVEVGLAAGGRADRQGLVCDDLMHCSMDTK